MSEVSIFGSALYGDKWQSNIANMLSKNIGSVVHRSTVQSWHKRNNLPEWAKEILIKAVQERHETIIKLRASLGLDTLFIKEKIEKFLLMNPSLSIDHNKELCGRVVYGIDKYKNKMYDAEIIITDEKSCKETDGWISILNDAKEIGETSSKHLRVILQEQLVPENAVHKEELDDPQKHFFERLKSSFLSVY